MVIDKIDRLLSNDVELQSFYNSDITMFQIDDITAYKHDLCLVWFCNIKGMSLNNKQSRSVYNYLSKISNINNNHIECKTEAIKYLQS